MYNFSKEMLPRSAGVSGTNIVEMMQSTNTYKNGNIDAIGRSIRHKESKCT